ncbi:MAG: hypothetical protein KKE57_09575 [Proteobacteria bacterium]|nr:hypothetical protein [Pseudomonadota bacterium]
MGNCDPVFQEKTGFFIYAPGFVTLSPAKDPAAGGVGEEVPEIRLSRFSPFRKGGCRGI